MEDVCEGKDFSFPREEEKVLKLWDELDAFQEQLRRTEGLPEYIFYDGPPFATGLPHYGHILAGTIKDVVTRYQSSTGHHVTRRFGWDCHGLPVEYEIDQRLNIKSRDDVLAMGIGKYNEECRSIVMRYASEWEAIVKRVGRWIDFKNDYKTLDASFMESVWWVFKQLHEKGLVYRGYKVMPYSTGCHTPLSNFEAGLNYKDVSDPAVMVAFPLKDDPHGASLVAWTTTPWTLPSNLALCLNPSFTYTKVRNKATGAVYIVAESRLCSLPGQKKPKAGQPAAGDKLEAGAKADGSNSKGGKSKGGKKGGAAAAEAANGVAEGTAGSAEAAGWVDPAVYEVVETLKGTDLAGRRYEPVFPYFESDLNEVAFVVVVDGYVTDDSGSGVVHCAPAFGEDDYRVCVANNIIKKGEEIPCPVDQDGCFTPKVSDFSGVYVKDADKAILAAIKAKGRLVSSGSIMHSYPFCWRSETPLIYKAVPSWFVCVEKIKERLLVNNAEGTRWVPESIKEKRFHNWLENARDWAVSRSRFWGTPLPIWTSADGQEIKVVGSVQELQELSGVKATDLHRHFIDHIEIPSTTGRGTLRRVEDVFDCWFESGSMPYAYIHYPFENKELFDRNFPGHFVAEGLDQTRGWFYTLMVLSTALFDKPAFRNLICNGLVLAEDGKKMSKRLKNYPPPMEVVNDYGADALRLYLINSPVVRAEPLRFKKDGVFAVVRDVFLPWYNAYRFLVQNAKRLEAEGNAPFEPLPLAQLVQSHNTLDHWILSSTQSLVAFVRQEMEAYRLYTVVPHLLKFIDNLTNVYVRFNRRRLKGQKTTEEDCRTALSTLFHVLLTTCKAMAPFTPFFTEAMYQNLRRGLLQMPATGGAAAVEESVHFCSFPKADQKADERIERSVDRMMTVIDLARNIRERHNKPLKTPLKEMVVVHPDPEFLEDITGKLLEYVTEELNVRSLAPCADTLKYASLRAEPDFSVLGKRLGKSMGAVAKEVKAMDAAAIAAFTAAGEVVIAGQRLTAGEIKVVRDFKPPEGVAPGDVDAAGDGEVLVVLDLRPDTELLDAGTARELVNRVQKLRKKAGLEPIDPVEVFIELHAPAAAAHADAPGKGNNSNSKGKAKGKDAAAAAGSQEGSEEDPSMLPRVLASQASYIEDSVGGPLMPISACPKHAVVIASERYSNISGASSFTLTLTRPSLCFADDALLSSVGSEAAVEGVKAVLLARDPLRLRSQLQDSGGKITVVIDGMGEWELQQGVHFFLTARDAVKATTASAK